MKKAHMLLAIAVMAITTAWCANAHAIEVYYQAPIVAGQTMYGAKTVGFSNTWSGAVDVVDGLTGSIEEVSLESKFYAWRALELEDNIVFIGTGGDWDRSSLVSISKGNPQDFKIILLQKNEYVRDYWTNDSGIFFSTQEYSEDSSQTVSSRVKYWDAYSDLPIDVASFGDVRIYFDWTEGSRNPAILAQVDKKGFVYKINNKMKPKFVATAGIPVDAEVSTFYVTKKDQAKVWFNRTFEAKVVSVKK